MIVLNRLAYIAPLFFLIGFCLVSKQPLSFDIRNNNIGYENSPNSNSKKCLEQQTFAGYSTTLYYNSAVEPVVVVNPKNKSHVVAAWQQDRFSDSGSLEIGIARSSNGGKHWKHSVVPFQNCERGFSQRVTDCWLSYSSDGEKLYLVALVQNASTDPNTLNQEGIVVATSKDNGKRWSIPHYLSAGANSIEAGYQLNNKPTVTADPFFKHHAYVVWDSFDNSASCPHGVLSFHSNTFFSKTTNGGKSWSDHKLIYDPYPDLFNTNLSNGNPNDCRVTNNIIVGLPNGDLLNFMTRIYAKPGATDAEFISDVWPYQYTLFDIAFIRSTNHGATWDETATVVASMDANEVWTCGYNYNGSGKIISGNGVLCRTENPYFTVAVNPYNGNIYVVWQSSQFGTANNYLPQIALARSRDGGLTWSNPVKVNRTPANSPNPQAFTPSLAVNKAGYLGLMYHDFRKNDTSCANKTKTNTWLALYKETPYASDGNTGVGLNFKKEVCVSENSYMMEDGPTTDKGVMTNGDYDRLVILHDDFYALYIQSHRGPFNPAQTLIDSPADGILVLDNNKRTSPYFSKIDT